MAIQIPHEKRHILGAQWRHLANTIGPSVSGDAVLCQITLTTCLLMLHYEHIEMSFLSFGLKGLVLGPCLGLEV